VPEIRITRVECLGHFIRVEDYSILKVIHNTKPEGSRGFGRPEVELVT
jgi:hypothetical protein